jgi:hypothetical protein
MRTVDSANPLARNSTSQPSTARGVALPSGIPPRAELAMWLRVRVAYMALVLALRSEAASAVVIHSRAKVPTVSVVSLAG